MNMYDCLQAAIDAGQVSADLGKEAQKKYTDRVTEHERRGLPKAVAERQAGDDIAETISKGIKAERHATAAQLRIMERNVERYSGDPLTSARQLRNDIQFVQSEWLALKQQVFSRLHEFLKNHKTSILGNTRKRALLKDVTRELHLEDSGNPHAKAIAEGILEQYEYLRQLGNSLGMDIGKLDDFGVPHTHNADKILRAGYDAWFTKIYDGKMIDWSRIINHKTGKPFVVKAGAQPFRADADEFLKPIFENISTKGWIKREPNMAMVGKSLPSSRADQRVLHFLNADKWMEYNDLFGVQNPFDAVVNHISGMSRDIAMMRTFGFNSKAGLEHAIQVIQKSQKTKALEGGASAVASANKINAVTQRARVDFSYVDGSANEVESKFMATIGSTIRTVLVPVQLGSAVFSTPVDWVTARSAAQAVGLNPNGATIQMMKQIGTGHAKDVARDLGFIMETWIDTMTGQAKAAADVWRPQLADRFASGVLRASGLNYLTDCSRVAMKVSFGNDLASYAAKSWDELHPNMRSFMESRRVGAADWDAMRDGRVIFTDRNGGKHINARHFMEHTSLPREQAEDIAIRWTGLVEEYAESGITTGTLAARTALVGGIKAGTPMGELARSGGMYRGVALSRLFIFLRRWNEMGGGPQNRYTMAIKYAALGTFAAGIGMQLRAVFLGRDPRPMDDPRFWAAAYLQGGGLGIFGDFFYSTENRAGGGLAETIAGPVVGLVSDVGTSVVSNVSRLTQGEDTSFGRDAANLFRRYNPAASFWPIRFAFERLVSDQIQLALDPEAESQMRKAEKKLKKEYSTQSWWAKGSLLPDRLPDLSNIFSE